jgi:uncharacterized protein (TIGR03435 family)
VATGIEGFMKQIAWRVGFAIASPLLFRAAQTPPERELDVVSIKLDRQKGPPYVSSWRADPSMIRMTSYTLQACIERAYGLKPYQIQSKGPGWIATDWYDIEARTAAPAAEAEIMRMLQPALTERFHLVLHRETAQMPVLLLQVARGGVKFQPAATTEGPNLDARKDYIQATHLGMDELADVLGQFVTERPVVNRTGLKGEYQFRLEFAPKEGDDADQSSIFSALTEQLGLKLEAGRAPVEVLVIDRAERPSEN